MLLLARFLFTLQHSNYLVQLIAAASYKTTIAIAVVKIVIIYDSFLLKNKAYIFIF